MPLLSQLVSDLNPFDEDQPDQTPQYYGDEEDETYRRSKVHVSDEVGRRVIQKVQPETQGLADMPGQFLSNLGSDVGEFAKGVAGMAIYPVLHPRETADAIFQHPVATAEKFGGALVEGYKENYTPHEDESVPGMILRRFYEKPFTSLMDASALGQIAFGGAGLAARAATMGVRGAAEGAASLAPELAGVAQKASSAQRAVDLLASATERAKRIDPINLAMDAGKALFKTAAPDKLAELNTISSGTDAMAERTVVMRANEDLRTQRVNEAFGGLNTAERSVIWPYISGRLNMDSPLGPTLMQHTGEWVPLKGEVIRPEALEAARQQYIPIQKEYEFRGGYTPEQAGQRAGERAMNYARDVMKDNFDPTHPMVQEYVQNEATLASRESMERLQKRAAGEMMTSLDVAKDRAWRTKMEEEVAANLHASIEDAESGLPRPERTTVEEALQAMGPQGGLYFPHSSEAYTREQSTIGNVLTKMGEALPYKENQYTQFASGVMEHQDPVKQLLRSYATYEKNQTWLQMGYDAAEKEVEAGRATRFKRGEWDWTTDPDVLKGTHQPFHPGKMIADDLAEEDVQRLFTRMLEVSDDTKSLNIFDVMQGITDNAGKGPQRALRGDVPVYKIPTAMGKGLKAIKDQFEPPTNPLLRMTDKFTQYWNWANLNLRLTRINNNVVGNTFFGTLQGVHPFSVKGLTSLVAMGRALAGKAGIGGEEGSRLAKVFDLPGIRSGGLFHELETLPQADRLGNAGKTIGERMVDSRIPGVSALGKWSNKLAQWNSNIEAAYRGASLFYELSPNSIGRAQRMLGHAADTMTLGEKIEGFARSGAEVTMKNPEYRGALKSVNRFFHDYERTTPFERSTVRRIFPYHKFWKHSTDLIVKYPFEHPLKGAVMRTMGNAAIQDTKDTLKQWGLDYDRDVKSYLGDSIPVKRDVDPVTGKTKVVWMFNARGPNPFSQMTGLQAEQALQMLNPVVKIAIEQSTGINLFTRERYRGALSSFSGREVDPETGNIVESYEHPSWPEAFLRSFWPYQTAKEFVAQGRVPLDTASLLDMVTKSPNAWAQIEPNGQLRRKPQKTPYQSLFRAVGPQPVGLQPPTHGEKQQRKGFVNEQLRNLLQRYPEKKAEIMDAIRQTSDEVRNERR